VLHIATHQQQEGHVVEIVRLGLMPDYVHQGLTVNAVEQSIISKQAYYSGLESYEALEKLVHKLQPDVVYVHDRNPHFSGNILAKIKSSLPKCKIIGVYHSPGQSCPNRSLIHFEGKICDGKLKIHSCTECRISKTKGVFAGRMAKAFSLTSEKLSGNPLSELSHANFYTSAYIDAFKLWVDALDIVQFHAQWVKDLLLLNGVQEEKLINHPLELVYNFKLPEAKRKRHSAKIQLVCSGRCTNIKGQLVLLEALEQLDAKLQEQIELHFIGPGFDGQDDYAVQVRRKIETMSFVAQPQLLQPESVDAFLQDKHLGIVPSLWPETGPLVVLDFLKAGMQVISSPYIGIENKEIQHFEYGSSLSLANAIEKVIHENQDTYRLK
jgi:glycosyltransferase involved in cell wall biosynthesis